LNKGIILCSTILDSSTPLLNMGHIMLIRMRRKSTSSVKVLPSSCKIVWFSPPSSRKAHCNYLSAVRLTGEESSTRVLPNLSLFNITLTPTLRDEIITTQNNDKGMGHIKRRTRLAQSDQRQPIAGNGDAERGHWWWPMP
jgi:hypothetical protein